MKKISSFILVLLVIFGVTAGFVKPAAQAEQVYAVPGGNLLGTVIENIEYAYKEVDSYKDAYGIPGFISQHTCGITAGSNIVGAYQRIYPNLIPNHIAGSVIWGTWSWAGQDSYVESIFPDLYSRMEADSEGVTIDGYLTGLTSFVTSKNQTLTKSKISNSSMLNAEYKSALSSGKLLSLFVNGFNFASPVSYNGYDKLSLERYAGAHVLTVYGWYEVSYKNAQNVTFRKDTYLYVGTSYGSPSTGMILMNNYCTIDAAYVTHIS